MRTSMFGRVAWIAAFGLWSGSAAGVQSLTGATSIAIGFNHACATLQGGGAACWGYSQPFNPVDVLNRPSSGRAAGPVGGLTASLVSIAVGDRHACARSVAGELWCWGDDQSGQLGNGPLTVASPPGRVLGLANATAVAAAGSHSCAIASDAAWCWGNNNYGQLGDGNFNPSETPVAVSGLTGGVQQIVAGGMIAGPSFSCAIAGGAALCWGANFDGQLGDGTNVGKATAVAVNGLGSGVTAISAGMAHACAVHAGVVKCWGDNSSGQLGDGTLADRLAPVSVVNVGGVATSVAAGRSHSCALRNDGVLLCWGANFAGQLGDGTFEQRTIAAPVVGLGGSVIAIATGPDVTCALMANGEVRCFGDNSRDLLGLNAQATHLVPIDVASIPGGFAAVAAGYSHTCAVGIAGGAWCFGRGVNGELGTGRRRSEAFPTQVATLASGMAEVSSGDAHSCARTIAGGALCWGNGIAGQLGNGLNAEALAPVAVTGLASGVASISAGSRFTCASTTAGGVACWGDNADGKLGNGTTQSSAVPVGIPGLGGVQRVVAGASHACALRNGGVKCWGANSRWQLGDGTQFSRPIPGDVLSLTAGVSALSAGGDHTCAIAGGTLRCWGENNQGQLGDGTTLSRAFAVVVNGLPAAPVAVAAGGQHSCAIVADGSVWCWGMNLSGQIGPNWDSMSAFPATKPVLVPLGEPATAITAGLAHTCAVVSAGKARCWGAGYDSRLGNGEAQVSSVPRSVLVGDFATTTDVATAPSPSVEPEQVTITARVRASETVPQGEVVFYDGDRRLSCGRFPSAVPLSLGVATCTEPLLRGLHALRATYAGDRVNLPSSGTTTHQVQAAAGQHCAGFDDVDVSDPMCRNIEWLRNRGITQGCSAYAFCSAEQVNRLAMAAFMDRLGGVLSPEVQSGAMAGGTYFADSFSLLCTTPASAPAAHPRLAMVDAALTAADEFAEVEYRLVMRFNFTDDLLGEPVRTTLPGIAAHVPARLSGTFQIPAGMAPRFGVQARIVSGLPSVTDVRCTLRAAIVSGEDTHAPFDASSGGTP